jgi:kynurenine formamidase
MLDTTWLKKTWGTKEYFTEGPYLTRDASEFLAALPKLHLLGMDFPNIDSKKDMVMGKPNPNHQILLGRNIILLENLMRLEEVDENFFLSALPPRLVGGDGCPCRAVALFPLTALSDSIRSRVQ